MLIQQRLTRDRLLHGCQGEETCTRQLLDTSAQRLSKKGVRGCCYTVKETSQREARWPVHDQIQTVARKWSLLPRTVRSQGLE